MVGKIYRPGLRRLALMRVIAETVHQLCSQPGKGMPQPAMQQENNGGVRVELDTGMGALQQPLQDALSRLPGTVRACVI